MTVRTHPLEGLEAEKIVVTVHAAARYNERCATRMNEYGRTKWIIRNLLKYARCGGHVDEELGPWLAQLQDRNRGRKVTVYLHDNTRSAFLVVPSDNSGMPQSAAVLSCFLAKCDFCGGTKCHGKCREKKDGD